MPIESNLYKPFTAFNELGDGFADAVEPARFPMHRLRYRNQDWAQRVGLGALTEREWEDHFARFKPMAGQFSQPLALRYHGHQFRTYNPQLGDGRGFLFAQLYDSNKNRLLDLGTKGSGRTPWSRSGDGRLTLKGAVREALATEMLESLGVDTSKTFSIFETGESLERHDEPSPTRSAVLVRLSHSHIRFGTFQRLAYFGDRERIKKLIDYCLRHYFPHLLEISEHERPREFLRAIVHRSAELTASWMIAGFVHGVLNTDNMNVTGESFDYGPYRFLPTYDPSFTAAYFDHTGLYAYGRQPESVFWNLEQLALSLSLVDPSGPASHVHDSKISHSGREPGRADAQEELEVYGTGVLSDAFQMVLSEFPQRFNQAAVDFMVRRLGLQSRGPEQDEGLLLAVFSALAESRVKFEQFFHDWYGGRQVESEVYRAERFSDLRKTIDVYQCTDEARQALEGAVLKRAQPCSLLIDEIESIWEPIATRDDWSRFESKISEIREMGRAYGRR